MPIGNYLVDISDLKGISFVTKQVSIDKIYKLDVNSLPKGFYMIKVANREGISSAKFYKQ